MDSHINFLLKVVLALITFSLSFSLTKKDFFNVVLQPKALLLGLVCQMLLLPLLALIICSFFQLPKPFIFGIMLISFSPGGSTSNLLSYLFMANVALSISLTAINGILCVITIPILIALAQHLIGDIGFVSSFAPLQNVIDLLFVIILPGAMGVILNSYFIGWSKKIQPFLKIILPILLFSIFAAKIFGGKNVGGISITKADLYLLLFPLILVNLFGVLSGYFIAHFSGIRHFNKLTIAIEVGLQNTGLALLLAINTGVLNAQIPVLIFASFSFFS